MYMPVERSVESQSAAWQQGKNMIQIKPQSFHSDMYKRKLDRKTFQKKSRRKQMTINIWIY